MHGLKKEIDLSFPKGRELIQVAVGLYQVQFGFDGDVTISVEAEFHYFDCQNEWIWRQKPSSPQVAARTVALLGNQARAVEWLGFLESTKLIWRTHMAPGGSLSTYRGLVD